MAKSGVLALDLSSHVGWATSKLRRIPLTPLEAKATRAAQPISGVWHNPESHVGAFLAAYEDWLLSMILKYEVRGLIFETPVLPTRTTPSTVRKLMSLAGVTQMVAHRCNIRWLREGNVMTVKKHFCGHGGGGKERMIAEAMARGWKFETSDVVDAAALLEYASTLYMNERHAAA